MKTKFVILFLLILCIALFADTSRDIELSRRYVALGKFEEARLLLEPLFEQQPENQNIRLLLKQVYLALKDNTSLLQLIEAELANNPNDANLWIEVGNASLSSGNEEKAKKAYKNAVELVPNDKNKMLDIYRSYMTWGYTTEAAELLISARKRGGNNASYALEIASIYEIGGKWSKAADEYALYLQEFPDRFPDIERRMNEISADPEQLDDLADAVVKLKDNGIEGDRINRMLARLRVRQRDYLAAVKSLIDAETKRKMKGIYVLGFMREALAAGAHDAVIYAGEYLADAEPRYTQESNLTMAYSLKAQNRIDEAENLLKKLIKSKTPAIAGEALVLFGRIDLENKKDLKAAREMFTEAIESYPKIEQTAFAYRGLTEVYFRNNDFSSAEQVFTKRRTIAPDDPWALFGLGELAFFRGSTDTAGAYFRGVVLSFPKSEEANDAVQYLALLADASSGADMSEITSAFAALRKGDSETALLKFDSIIEEHSSQPWADLILWERAQLRLSLGDKMGCRTDLKSISELFPDGYHASQAVEILGDLALESGDLQAATHYFNQILTEHPSAVNIERVRNKLKAIPGNI